jgi:uncharacterized glyoxalase superfamily protein PhnB
MAAKKKGGRVAVAKSGAKKLATKVKAGAKKTATKLKAARPKKALPIPKGYHTITPALVIRGAADAIEFYKKAFGAKQRGGAMSGPDGKVMHAEIQIGDAVIMVADEFPAMGSKSPQSLGGTGSSLLIYTRDCDALFARATAAGAKVTMPLADQFWGDRYGRVEDPFGHQWEIATHKEDLTPKEMRKRAEAMFSQPPPGAPAPGAAQ